MPELSDGVKDQIVEYLSRLSGGITVAITELQGFSWGVVVWYQSERFLKTHSVVEMLVGNLPCAFDFRGRFLGFFAAAADGASRQRQLEAFEKASRM